jgi:hypothetical protein
MKTGWMAGTRGVMCAGLVGGLLVGMGVLIGSWTAKVTPAVFSEIPLQATATDSGEKFAIATGYIADNVEGCFFLDFLTGDMQCWVINSRTGGQGGYFVQNVVGDLGVDGARANPRYLMVTGQAMISGGSSAMKPADCLVYVADSTTGNFAVYTIPWNRQAAAANRPQQSAMKLVFKGSARNLEIRGQ